MTMFDRQKLSISRRISIAPMMDWSDSPKTQWSINGLRAMKSACSSSVAVASACSVFDRTGATR